MWFRPTPYLRSRIVLDLGVAAVVGLQFQGPPSRSVMKPRSVGGEEGQLGTGRGLHPPDDEPHRCGAGLSPEGGVGGQRHIGGAVPVGERRPVCIGIASIRFRRLLCWRMVMEKRTSISRLGGDESVGVEAAVGPRRKLPAGPGTANPAHRFTQEVGGAPSGVGAALAQPGHQHVAGPAATANRG